MSFPIAWGGFSLLRAARHFADDNRVFDQLSAAHPSAANILSGVIDGALYGTHALAGILITTAAADVAPSLTVGAVTWMTGYRLTDPVIGGFTSALVETSGYTATMVSMILAYELQRDLADRAAVWLTNLATLSYWQSAYINAKACLGYINAADLNKLTESELHCITSSVFKSLPAEELPKLSHRVINALSESELDNILSAYKDQLKYEKLNARASENQLISGDELNKLCPLDIRGLDSDVLDNLSDSELQKLAPHVINGLSRIALVSIDYRVIMKLSHNTLNQLKPHILNNFSYDLAGYLSDDIKQHLSVKPVRWQRGMSLEDIYMPTYRNNIIAGKRSIWIEKALYPYVPAQVCAPFN